MMWLEKHHAEVWDKQIEDDLEVGRLDALIAEIDAEYMEEALMEKQYVDLRDQGYWISGSRVSLESVIFAFLDGYSPETIVAECFPILSLEQVYGAIAYYLSNRRQVNAYLQQVDEDFEAFQQATLDPDPFLATLKRCPPRHSQ